MKFLLTIIAICSIACVYGENEFGLSDSVMEALANIDINKLPAVFLARKDDSHWCCANNQPATTMQLTRITAGLHTVATRVKTGYSSCGLFGTGKCSIYSTTYKQNVYYYIETADVPTANACLNQHIVCCKGYIQVGKLNEGGNCYGK